MCNLVSIKFVLLNLVYGKVERHATDIPVYSWPLEVMGGAK